MKIRKIMTAITAAAMAGVMFAGCSSNNGGSSAGSSADSSSAANSSSATDNGGAENNGTGSGEVSLTVWGIPGGSGDVKADVRRICSRKSR